MADTISCPYCGKYLGYQPPENECPRCGTAPDLGQGDPHRCARHGSTVTVVWEGEGRCPLCAALDRAAVLEDEIARLEVIEEELNASLR